MQLSFALIASEVEMIRSLFLSHPESVGETYLEHQGVALSFAAELLTAGVACAVHAVVPGLFPRTASRVIERLHTRLVMNRHAKRHEAHPESLAA
jgi:hypothetical protein